MNRPSRKNGFQRPYTCIQFSIWIIFPLFFLIFLLTTIPLLPVEEIVKFIQIISTVLNSALFLSVITYWVLTSLKDAGDSSINSSGLFCTTCFKYVKENSRHCKICNKCVYKFDHHCTSLNNCIGEQNYSKFVKLLFSLQAYTLSQFIFSLLTIIRLTYYSGITHRLLNIPTKASLSFNFLTLLLSFSVFSLVTGLLLLHLYLYYRGLTTYEYIISKRLTSNNNTTEVENKENQKKIGFSREIEITRIIPEILNNIS